MIILLALVLIACVAGGLMSGVLAAKLFLLVVGTIIVLFVLFMGFATIVALVSSRINPR